MRTAVNPWLAEHCATLDGVVCGAVLFKRGDGLNSVVVWPEGRTVHAAMTRAAAAAVSMRGPVSVPLVLRAPAQALADGPPEHEGRERRHHHSDSAWGSQPVQIVAHPLEAAGVLVGAVVLSMQGDPPPPPSDLAKLQAHANTFAQVLRPEVSKTATAAATATATAQHLTQLSERQAEMLRLAHAVFACPDYRSAATLLTSSLAARFACDRVSLGFRSAGVTQVEAMSDGSKINPRRALFTDLAAAMDEAMDEAASLVWPPAADAPPRVLAGHAGLARRQGLASVCSVPLVLRGRVIGALTLEQAVGPPIDAATLALLDNLALTVVPWLANQRDAAMPLNSRLRRAVRRASRALLQPGHGRVKLGALAALLLAVGLLAVPVRWEVRADARLEGRSQRALAAPGDGFIRQVFVRPGDRVQAGQTLVAFEGEDLRLEYQRLSAELAGEDAALGEAMHRNDRARLAISSARVAELTAQRDLVSQRLVRAEVKAPFDGVVIAGDLNQQLGAPVQRGAVLLTVAPADGVRAIVEVADADMAEVRLGQTGSLVLTAHPDKAWAMTVQRITPLAMASQGRQVFEVEVGLAATDLSLLLPGMHGVARLVVGEQALGWQWSREALAWLRLATWRWLG